MLKAYIKASKGEIKNMTGISVQYEPPVNPDIEVITDNQSIEVCLNQILKFLNKKLI